MKYIFCNWDFLRDEISTGHDVRALNVFFNSINNLNDENIKVVFFSNNPSLSEKFKFVYDRLQIVNTTHCIPLRPNVNRFFCYRNFIEKNIHLYNKNDQFIHCDPRDTYFQENIFAEIDSKHPQYKNKNLFFEEDQRFIFNINDQAQRKGLLIDEWNNQCIRDLHNKKLYKTEQHFWDSPAVSLIKNNNIICTGFIYFGNIDLFTTFLNTFTMYTSHCLTKNKLFYKNKNNKMGKCNDQGIVNSMIYNKISTEPKVIIKQNEQIVTHMSIVSAHNVSCEYKVENNLVIVNNKIPCVIHQYNNPGVRQNFPHIAKHLQAYNSITND